RAYFYVWPLLTRWYHDGEEFRETQILWHLFRWRNGTGEKPNTLKQLVPFFSYRNDGVKERWYHPILFWHGSRRMRFDGEVGKNYQWDARYSFPLFFSKKRRYEDGPVAVSRFVFP